MSIRAVQRAFDLDIRPSGRKFVVVALANFADENDSCWPSHKTVAEMTGMSLRAVRRNIASLQQDGLISKERRRRPDGSWISQQYILGLWQEWPLAILPMAKIDRASGQNRPSQRPNWQTMIR